MRKLGLRSKLVVGGASIVLITLSIVSIYAVIQASRAMRSFSTQRVASQARSLAEMTDLVLSEELKLVKDLSVGNTTVDVAAIVAKEGIAASTSAVEKLERKLSNAMELIGSDYDTFCVADPSGTVYVDGSAGTYRGTSVAGLDYFENAKKGRISVGSPDISKKTGFPVIPVGAPIISKSGDFAGCMITVLKIDFLNQQIASTQIGKAGYVFITDDKGRVIAHPTKDLILKLNITSIEGMKTIAGKMIAGESGVETYDYEGISHLAGFAPVKQTRWSIGVSQPESELMDPIYTIRNGVLMIAAVFLVITVIVIVLFAQSVSRPILSVVHGLTQAAEQVTAASDEVSSASQSLAEGTSQQAASIEETSAALEEMSSMTEQNADHANQANTLMVETGEIVEAANTAMGELATSMKDISQASEEIQKIIKTIDDVAFQTNLLALNAAVEAARAGEAGAGFAVVAEEVRNLAIRTTQAAKDTGHLIENTVNRIHAGSELLKRTETAFLQVADGTARMRGLIAEIAGASREQNQGIGQINKAIAEMDGVVQQNAANAEQSASASQQMRGQSGYMRDYVTALMDILSGGRQI